MFCVSFSKYNTFTKGVRHCIRVISSSSGISGYASYMKYGFNSIAAPVMIPADFLPGIVDFQDRLTKEGREGRVRKDAKN